MSDSPTPPFDSAANPYTATPPVQPSSNDVSLRPTGVTVVAVLCLLGGGMGVLSGIMQLLQPLFQGMATAFVPTGQAGDAQREWFAEIQAVNARYMIPNLSVSALALIVSCCLVVGGIALLRPTRWSSTWIRRTLLAAIAVASVQLVLFFIVQAALQPIMARQFEVMAGPNGNPLGESETMKSIQLATMAFTYAFAIFWFLVKIVAYIWGRRYLNRDHVKAYLSEASA